MSQRNPKINPKIFEKNPSFRFSWIKVEGVSYHQIESFQIFLKKEYAQMNNSLHSESEIKDWREAYRKFGAKPKKHLSSIENLVNVWNKNGSLQSINPLVNLYNLVSLKYGLPMGADDCSKVSGNITLTYSEGKKPFTPLGKTENTVPKPGEVVYEDQEKTLCRRWNWRECEESKITLNTHSAFFYIESINSKSNLDEAQKFLVLNLQKYFSPNTITKGRIDAS